VQIRILDSKEETGKAAAVKAASILSKAISQKGRAVFVAATGASQFGFLDQLTADETVDWSKTVMFHLDEYVGIPESHPASFRKYLRERLISKAGNIGTVHLIKGDTADPQQECERLKRLIGNETVDVAFVGVGENGHLAFNDPPADFEVEAPFIVVDLDENCRKQQVGEGWFATLDDVPRRAISMSIKQIMRSEHIVCTVPEVRKARAVKECFGGQDITPSHPASILKKHPAATVFLDRDSASLL